MNSRSSVSASRLGKVSYQSILEISLTQGHYLNYSTYVSCPHWESERVQATVLNYFTKAGHRAGLRAQNQGPVDQCKKLASTRHLDSGCPASLLYPLPPTILSILFGTYPGVLKKGPNFDNPDVPPCGTDLYQGSPLPFEIASNPPRTATQTCLHWGRSSFFILFVEQNS